MTDLDDIWLNAFAAVPDLEPLARLIRSDTPMPPGARDLLANLLDPHDDSPSDSFVLKAVRSKKWARMLGTGNLDPQKRDDAELGVIARHAGINVGGRTKHVCEREIRRYRAKFRALGRYLHGLD